MDMLDTTIPPIVMDILVTMARGLPMLNPRPMLILTSSMVDIMDLAMPTMDFTILPMVVMHTMDSVDTVVMVDMDLDVVSTLDKLENLITLNRTAQPSLFSPSVTKISVLDVIFW